MSRCPDTVRQLLLANGPDTVFAIPRGDVHATRDCPILRISSGVVGAMTSADLLDAVLDGRTARTGRCPSCWADYRWITTVLTMRTALPPRRISARGEAARRSVDRDWMRADPADPHSCCHGDDGNSDLQWLVELHAQLRELRHAWVLAHADRHAGARTHLLAVTATVLIAEQPHTRTRRARRARASLSFEHPWASAMYGAFGVVLFALPEHAATTYARALGGQVLAAAELDAPTWSVVAAIADNRWERSSGYSSWEREERVEKALLVELPDLAAAAHCAVH